MNDEAQDDVSSAEPSPAAQLEHKEQTARLARLLEHLPENQREVLRLRFQCDLSYKEIADITNLGVGNVGFIIHTALKRLRQLWPVNLEVNP
jgi:RNA polymerase sigma-70 factor (ECF subfamily)